MTDPKLDRLYDRIQRATAHADDPRDSQLWRDVAARLRADEAAVAAANQRTEQAEAALHSYKTVAEKGRYDLTVQLAVIEERCAQLEKAGKRLLRTHGYEWADETGAKARKAWRALVADQPATPQQEGTA